MKKIIGLLLLAAFSLPCFGQVLDLQPNTVWVKLTPTVPTNPASMGYVVGLVPGGSNAWNWIVANSNAFGYMTSRTGYWDSAWSWVNSNSGGVWYVFSRTSTWDNASAWVSANSNSFVYMTGQTSLWDQVAGAAMLASNNVFTGATQTFPTGVVERIEHPGETGVNGARIDFDEGSHTLFISPNEGKDVVLLGRSRNTANYQTDYGWFRSRWLGVTGYTADYSFGWECRSNLYVLGFVQMVPNAVFPDHAAGRIFYHSVSNKLFCSDGSAWNALW